MSSLFVIETALSDLFDTRQEIIAEVAFTDQQIADKQAALDAVDAAIVETVTAEVREVDNISRFLLELKVRREAIGREVERLEEISTACENTERRIKDMCLQIMRDTDTKKLEGRIGTLKRQGNGGVQPVEVVQRELVPERFIRVTMRMTAEQASECLRRMGKDLEGVHFVSREPDKEAIRKELEKRVPCPECDGTGEVDRCGAGDNTDVYMVPCGLCGGQKTVANGVSGCRLLPWGEQLRVS